MKILESKDGKITFSKPGTMVYPVPAAMVSLGSPSTTQNIITIAWTGIVNSEPPMTYISVRKSRFSHQILMEEKEFVINLGSKSTAFQTDYCGVKSGKDVDKWKEMNLTKIDASIVKCPMIKECPVNIECKVFNIIELPSHDMFMAEIVAVHGDIALMNGKNKFCIDKAELLAYSHGEYFALDGPPLGTFGYSIMKEKTKAKKSS